MGLSEALDAGNVPSVGWRSMPAGPTGWGWLETKWLSKTALEVKQVAFGSPPSQRLYLAVRWTGSQEIVVLSEPFVERTVVELTPPPEIRSRNFWCSSGESAQGQLLAYIPAGDAPDPSRDELVAVSTKPNGLFADPGFGWDPLWDSCRADEAELPIVLTHDPRLPIALCAPNCTVPLFDRTLVASALLQLTPQSHHLELSVVGASTDYAVEINGVRVSSHRLDDAHWVEGVNTIRVTAGSLPPWTAEVVIPRRDLGLQLTSGLPRTGAPFTLTWSAPWSTSAIVTVQPLDLPVPEVPTKHAINPSSYFVRGETLTEPFPEFRNASEMPIVLQRAQLTVVASVANASYSLWISQALITPVAP